MSTTITEGYAPGCIGRITQLHAEYYTAAHRFGVNFEARVAEGLAEFCPRLQAGRDGLWLAWRDGRIEGSIGLDARHADADADAEGAHLRWFITSDALRGTGVGRELLRRALTHADACGYASVHLWTFAGLDAARHLYESHGFALVHESPGTQWGTPVREQRFVRPR